MIEIITVSALQRTHQAKLFIAVGMYLTQVSVFPTTVFPRLERTRSINFIQLPRGGLYEVRVVIGGAFD